MAVHRGTYILVISLERESTIAVGKLGQFTFPPGFYLYAGSAHGGLVQRVSRHLRRQKRLRWHIDYLLEQAEVVEVWYRLGDERCECEWAATAAGMPRAQIIAPRFGSTDCRCPAHLVFLPRRPSSTMFRRQLGTAGRRLKRVTPGDFPAGP